MEPEAIEDLSTLEPYFAELKSWPSTFGITAAMWSVLSQRVKEALESDLAAAGYDPKDVRAVEYEDGRLVTVSVIVPYVNTQG